MADADLFGTPEGSLEHREDTGTDEQAPAPHSAESVVLRRSMVGVGGAALLGAGAFGLRDLFGGDDAGPDRARPPESAGPASGATARPPSPTPDKGSTESGPSVSPPGTDPAGTSATTRDRDQSYSGFTTDVPDGEGPSVGGPQPGPLGLPVKDTAAARAHLQRRATLGAGAALADEIAEYGMQSWLSRQLDPRSIPDPVEQHIAALFPLAAAAPAVVRSSVEENSWDAMREVGYASLARQLFSTRQIYEVTVDVMHNLLQVTIPSDGVWTTGPDYEAGVIRRHAFGSFTDMLLAAARHPAMLTYLDNVSSTKAHVNENYGRELLELHTVGVGAGYTESDVLGCARVMSGRRVSGDTFVYEAEHHATGPVTVLGWSAKNASARAGLEVGDSLLRYLAGHPATATTVARSLAVRFVSDRPSDRLVQKLAAAYLTGDTRIVPVLKAMFADPEFWSTVGSKGRRPVEDVAGVVRSLGIEGTTVTAKAIVGIYWQMHVLGHAPLAWPAPDGYPDVAAAWASASSMVGRWNLHHALVHGWFEGMTPRPTLAEELAPTPGATNEEWISSIAMLLTGRTPTPGTVAGLLTFIDAAADAPASDPFGQLAPELARLVFDSPTYLIR